MRNRRIFVLDDEFYTYRRALGQTLKGHDLTIAVSAIEAPVIYASRAPYDFLLLDHDMVGYYQKSSETNTGYRFCEWLVNHPKRIGQCHLHSQNNAGRVAMASLLKDHGVDVFEHFYGPDYLEFLKVQLL